MKVEDITAVVIVSCTEDNGELRKNLIQEIQGLYFKKNISGTKGWIEGSEPTFREGI